MAEKKTRSYELLADGTPVAGPDCPYTTQIEGLIQLLATIHDRFGNTCVKYWISWGSNGLWTEDAQKTEIQSLKKQVAELIAELEAKETELQQLRRPGAEGITVYKVSDSDWVAAVTPHQARDYMVKCYGGDDEVYAIEDVTAVPDEEMLKLRIGSGRSFLEELELLYGQPVPIPYLFATTED